MGGNWTQGESDERTNSWVYEYYVEDKSDLAVAAFIGDRTTGRILNTEVVYADNTVGVSDRSAEIMNLSVYPNPARDHFYLNLGDHSSEEGTVQLVDMRGRVVLKEEVPAGYMIYQMDIQHLDRGIYVLQWVESGQVKGVSKVVKTQ